MEYVVSKNYLSYGMQRPRPEYSIGGKTGTAQVPKPGGGYYEDRFNGTFMGFVGGDKPQYVIVVRVNEPKIGGYAGSKAAAPIFGRLANMLIDNFNVTPKGQ
jgi:cell division protein FtsI/penicillin-binding protein 2